MPKISNAFQGNPFTAAARELLGEKPLLRASLSNTGWLFLDRLSRSVAALFVGVWVARYLGPSQFGLYSYAITAVTMLSSIGNLGFTSLLVREIVLEPEATGEILGTAFVLKLIAGALASVLAVIYGIFVADGQLLRLLISIMALGSLVQAFDVFDFWFQSQMQSRLLTLARFPAFLVALALKVGLIVLNAPLALFAWVFVTELVLTAAGVYLMYRRLGFSTSGWRFNRSRAYRLLKDGWPIAVAFITYIAYSRVDQIVVGNILSAHQAGLYYAAAKLTEVWTFIPVMFATGVYPAMVSLYKSDRDAYLHRVRQVTDLFAWGALWLGLLIAGVGPVLIDLTVGPDYAESYRILVILIWGQFFMFIGVLRSQWLTITNNQQILLWSNLISIAVNVASILILVRYLGVVGVAIATLVTHAFSLYLINAFFPKLRVLFFVQCISIARAVCQAPVFQAVKVVKSIGRRSP